ncbi:MAG: hypothetical protein ACRD0J_18535 [Acidimicrobiales bacterium]
MIRQNVAVGSDVDLRWSDEVGQARWIADRLAPFGSGLLTSVVPGGFESYTRLLHPAEDATHGAQLVRWADVAAWSGLELVPGAQFHEIAIPEEEPAGSAPWRSQGPQEGTLCAGDAAAAVEVLAGHTTTPEHCWFCLWDGYGWDGKVLATADDRIGAAGSPGAPVRVPDPIPAAVRSGARVALPYRDYLLYEGPIGAALAFVDSEGRKARPRTCGGRRTGPGAWRARSTCPGPTSAGAWLSPPACSPSPGLRPSTRQRARAVTGGSPAGWPK